MLTKRKAFGNFRKKFDRTKKKKSGKHVRGRGVVFDPTRRVGGAHSEVISAISEVRTFFKTDLRKKKSRISQIRDSEFRVPRVPWSTEEEEEEEEERNAPAWLPVQTGFPLWRTPAGSPAFH